MHRRKSGTRFYDTLTHIELFLELLDSVNLKFGRTEGYGAEVFDEWKQNGPLWQRLVTCQELILLNRGGPMIKLDSPFFLKVRNEVWIHFESLPPEDTGSISEERVIKEFERVVSSSNDLPENFRGIFLECLKRPFEPGENRFRQICGLPRQEGGEDAKV